jgi:hypothetical protein
MGGVISIEAVPASTPLASVASTAMHPGPSASNSTEGVTALVYASQLLWGLLSLWPNVER